MIQHTLRPQSASATDGQVKNAALNDGPRDMQILCLQHLRAQYGVDHNDVDAGVWNAVNGSLT
jgi:hypothetical protein